MKKFISLVLALVMALSLTTIAWGADITDEATLKTALTTSGDYTLTAAVTLDEQVIVPAGTDVTINLNGQTLTLDYSANYAIVAKGNLTISGAGNVVVTGYGISTGYNSAGTVTINGGTYTASGCDYLFACFGGTITINAGVFNGEYCVVNNFAPYYGITGTVIINDGDFTVSDPAGYTVVALDSNDDVVADAISVSGGTFTDDVSDYVATGSTLVGNTVVPASSVGANILTGTYSVKGTNAGATAGAAVVSVTEAKAPKDANKNGVIDTAEVGNVKYFNIAGYTSKFVQVASVSEADMIVYYGNTDSVYAYLKAVPSVEYYGTGVPFANFGEKCGQVDYEPVTGVKYYSFENTVYETTTAPTRYLMVGNELVGVKALGVAPNAHVAAFTYDKDYKVVGVKCAECGVAGVIVKNYASLPEAIAKVPALYFPVNTGEYYYWTAAVASTDTDKVESAETFDAGIAMYVGMSVMAAAGSAVVLKKKD